MNVIHYMHDKYAYEVFGAEGSPPLLRSSMDGRSSARAAAGTSLASHDRRTRFCPKAR
jgi:pyruvate-formate lyase